MMQRLGQIYVYLQSVQAYISPPIAAVFLLGIFFKRLNSHGAMASLLSGFVLGMSRLILEVSQEHLSGILYKYATINFLHFAALLFVVCSSILILVSLGSPRPSREKLADLTYGTMTGESQSEPRWRRQDIILSALLVCAICAVWLYFTG
jgi:SSS family solute:Na+ symporter